MRRAEWFVERPWRLVALVFAIIFPLLLLGEIAAADTRERIVNARRDKLAESATRSAETVASHVETILDGITGTASNLRFRFAIGVAVRRNPDEPIVQIEPADVSEIATQLASLHAFLRRDVVLLAAVDPAGVVLATDPPAPNPAAAAYAIGSNQGSAGYFRAIANKDPRYVGVDAERGVVQIAVPVIRPPTGGIPGSLVAEVKTETVGAWLSTFSAELGNAYLLAGDGRPIFRLKSGGELRTDYLLDPAIAAARSGTRFVGESRDLATGEPELVATGRVATVGWIIVAVAPHDVVEAETELALGQQRVLRLGLGLVLVVGAALVAAASSAAIRRRRETAEALGQQTALSDVLRTISRSAFDLDAVLQTIVERAAGLVGAQSSVISRRDGDTAIVLTRFGAPLPVGGAPGTRIPVSEATLIGRALLTGKRQYTVDATLEADLPQGGPRTRLVIPFMRDGKAIGTLGVSHNLPRPFTDREFQMLETFADQAAIAIENVRLFNETKESLERQTALAEILSVIADSPADQQPVVDAVARSTTRYCGAEDAAVYLLDGEVLRRVAHHGVLPVVSSTTTPIERGSVVGRAVLERRTVHVADVARAEGDDFPTTRARAAVTGQRGTLATPMLREGNPIGVILLRKMEPSGFAPSQIQLVEAFADQAVIAIENVRLFNETKEALDRQSATAEVLKVMSGSPFELEPVLRSLVETATRLCGADRCVIFRREADVLRVAAVSAGTNPEIIEAYRDDPLRLDRTTITGRAVMDRQTVHLPDASADPTIVMLQEREPYLALTGGTPPEQVRQRSGLSVPLIREAEVIGAFTLWRHTVRPFSAREIELIETFARQAVIAIENVRLFNETKETLKQLTATSEILRVISETLGDPQPVMQAIVDTVLGVCSADSAGFFRRSGDDLILRAVSGTWRGPGPSGDGGEQRAFHGDSIVVTALEEGRHQHVTDTSADPRYDATAQWSRTRLAVPVLRGAETLGVIRVGRRAPGGFSEREIALVEGFAEQAAIAFENARLFNETKEALEQQTAVGEVLKTISRSAFDLQPVLDIVVNNAVRLAGADIGWMSRVENERFLTVSYSSEFPQSVLDELARQRADGHLEGPWIPLGTGGGLMGFTLAEGRTVHLPDVKEDPDLKGSVVARLTASRTAVGVPMLRDGRTIGGMVLARYEVRPFGEREIELVQTFADQAAIAIENVRLFNETKDSLDRQTAIAQVLGEISKSGFELQPVLESAIGAATKLCAAQQGFIYRREGDVFRLVVAHGITPEFKAFTEANPINPMGRGTVTGRVVEDRKTVHVSDVLSDPEYTYWEAQKLGDFRAILGVPMVRDEEVIGVMLLWRTEPQPFTDDQIALVTTFANQATIAIENVRLFDETREALDRQSAVSEVLKTISRTVFDLAPTLQTVVENAARLCDADIAWMTQRIGDARDQLRGGVRFGARWARTSELLALFNTDYIGSSPTDPRSIMGRAYLEHRTITLDDIAAEKDLDHSSTALAVGARSVLAVPVLRDNETLGVIIFARTSVRPFATREVELVETFADQAAIAIQNVRLFNEIQDKSRQLEVASRHKSEFLANMSHELRTPLNAIIGFSEVLIQGLFGDVNEKQRDYLQDVIGSGQHLLSLINDILDLSKIEAGRMELELSTFSFQSALQSGVTIVRERAARNGIALKVDYSDDVGQVEADERKVKQILYNLLSNAVKFTPDGGTVKVTVRRDNGDVRVDVQDNGIGIAEADQARIFEEFQQVGRERSREGTGLGLTLTKRFVELHGGRIWLESAPGKGSTFTFTLPLRQAAPVRA